MTLGERVINSITGGSIARLQDTALKAQSQASAAGRALSQMTFGRPQLTLLQTRTRYDFQTQVGNGMTSASVMAPVMWIARSFPEAPCVVRDDEEIVDNHPMAQLIHRPNPYYSGSVLWMATLISYTIDGNAYWMKIRNGMGQVIQLWYVPHWLIKPNQLTPNDYVSNYLYTPGGKSLEIATSEIVHLRFGLDPENTMKGFSLLKPLYREIFTDDEAANWTAHLLRNSGVPGTIVAPGENGQNFNEEDAKNMKEDFKNGFSGDRRGEPFISTVPIDIHKFAWSPSEMDMAKLREIPEERVCAMLGIPAAVVGFGSGLAQTKVGATMKEMREMAYESNIVPTQRLMAEEIDVQLLPDFEKSGSNRRTAFDHSHVRVLQEDRDELFTRMGNGYKAGFVMKSEARKAVNLPITPADDVYLVPFSSVEVPAGSNEAQVTADAAAKTQGKSSTRPEMKISKRQAALVRQLNTDVIHLSEKMATELNARFSRIGEEAAQAYLSHELVAAGLMTHSDNGNGHRTKGPADLNPWAADDHILVSQLIASIDTKPLDYKAAYLRVAHTTVGTINAHTGLGINLTDNMEREIVSSGGKRMGLVDIEAQTKDAMFKSLSEGRALGEGADAMAARIRDQVAAGPWSTSAIRAKVIARTETKFAQNKSSITSCQGGAGIVGMTCIDAQLGPTDEECEDLNGQDVSFEEADQLAQDEHPNGTRSFIPRMGEE